MGTCFSQPDRESNNPYSQGNNIDPAASSRPINSSQPQIQRPLTATSNQTGSQHQGRALTDRTNRPNKPLRRPKSWKSEDRTWTREELDKERRAFFDTAVTNVKPIWDTINQVCQVLWDGGDSGDDDGGLSTAQLILDAAEITLPNGDLVRGCYDKFGNHYRLPAYVVCDPANLAPSLPQAAAQASTSAAEPPELSDVSQRPVTPLTEEQAQIRRESKGKAVEDPVKITVKRSDLPETRHEIVINRPDSCRLIALKIEEQTTPPLDITFMVSLYYRGKKMAESTNLADNGFVEGDVISAMVFERDRSKWGT